MKILNNTIFFISRIILVFYSIFIIDAIAEIKKDDLKNIDQYYKQVNKYIDNGEYSKALKEFNEEIRINPNYARAYYDRGDVYYDKGEYDKAIEDYNKAIKIDPNSQSNSDLQFHLGESYYKLEQYENAIKVYERFKLIFPENEYVLNALFHSAASNYQLKKYAESADMYKEVLSKYPDTEFTLAALFNMALSLKKAKKLNGAASAYITFYTKYPTDANALSSLLEAANIYKDQGKYGKAIELYIKYPIKSNDETAFGILYSLEESYLKTSKEDEAWKVFEELRKMKPLSNEWRLSGLAKMADHIELINLAEAEKIYKDIIENADKEEWKNAARLRLEILEKYTIQSATSPQQQKQAVNENNISKTKLRENEDILFLNDNGMAVDASGNYYVADSGHNSIQKFDSSGRFITKWENNAAGYPKLSNLISLKMDTLGEVYVEDFENNCVQRYYSNGEFVAEWAIVETLNVGNVLLKPKYVMYFIANSLFNKNKYEEALEIYEKFEKENPAAEETPDAIYKAAVCYYELEYYTSAIDKWKSLLEKFKSHKRAPEALYQIADTYFKSAKYKEAVINYTRLIKDYPDSQWKNVSQLRMGQSYYNDKDYDNAIKEFNKYIDAYPDAEAYYNRGLAYKIVGKIEESEKDFKKAKELGYNPEK